ncbi:MAG: hypothetical protein NC418_06715, partial [Muribaculaceae bacterium]|nr:hypothetical protein [Muribaculaceae bacterium]
ATLQWGFLLRKRQGDYQTLESQKWRVKGKNARRAHHSTPKKEFIIYNLQFIIPSAAAAAPRPKAKPQQRAH